ncbi:MAG TPA: SRPBCC domain-containing protein [Caldimonas sp.]|nr:SRPBCC domain-containing protein [Caldimonas sp.]
MNTLVNPPGTPATALVLRRTLDASPETAFAAWADPDHVREWWHPEGFTTPSFEMDFRVGGQYRYCIRKDGNDGWARGTYREIVAPRRIVFTFRWEKDDLSNEGETLITVTFEPEGDRTRLTFRQEPFADGASRHNHGQGWKQVLDAFDAFVATTKARP